MSLFILLGFVSAFAVQYKSVQAMTKSIPDFTQLTPQEQEQVDRQIEDLWGNPQDTQLIEFKNGFAEDTDLSKSGDSWYYLTQDVSALCYGEGITVTTTHNIRILLNGYSIAGNAGFTADEKNSTVSIFDTIPNRKNQSSKYQYNANATKYYSYDSATQGYTHYTTSKPSGKDVTSLPSFEANSYIQVTGSALAPNLKQSETQVCLSNNVGKLYAFGIHIVGCIPYSDSLIFVHDSGKVELVQCTVIGNRSGTFATVSNGIETLKDALLSLYGCKIYGNQVYETEVNYGIQITDNTVAPREWDVIINNTTHIKKCNLGSISTISMTNTVEDHSYNKAMYIKDVAFNEVTANSFDGFLKELQNMSALVGTIELTYNIQLQYAGNSPDLNFIVHGRDKDTAPKSGKNSLVLLPNTVVNTIVLSGTAQIENGANIKTLSHTGGKLIDKRESPIKEIGTVSNSSSTVIMQSMSTVNTLDLRAGDYFGTGLISNTPIVPPDSNTNIATTNPSSNKSKVNLVIWIVVVSILSIVLIIMSILYIKQKKNKKDKQR